MRTNNFIAVASVSVLMTLAASLNNHVYAVAVPVPSGLVSHFDAQAAGSVLNPSSGIASNGQFVGTWEDQVGSSDASPTAVSRQPIYDATGGPFEQPVISFDGTSDHLVTTTISSLRTIVLFHRWDVEAPVNYLLDTRPGIASNGYVYDGNPPGIGGTNWSSYYVNGSAIAATGLAQVQNDTWQMTTFYGSSAAAASLRLMSRYTDTSGYGLGAIGEVLVYDRVISDSERLEIFDYVEARWLTGPVPEPSSFLLLGLGALGLVRHTRRRRQRS